MAFNPIQVIHVSGNTTVLEALRNKHKVETKFICASPNDIDCVDKLCSDHPRYWTIEVNGDYLNYNSMSKIKSSDKVVLKYASLTEK